MARSTVRVVRDSPGIAAMLKSDEIREGALRSPAERVLAEAQAMAPVVSGDYQDSLELIDTTTDRAAIMVASTISYGFSVEAAHGTLARALDAAGGA